MTDREYVQSKLVARTNADGSWWEAKNNRFHFHLVFRESIGIDWLEEQVEKASREAERRLELWELHPHDSGKFEVEVRELARREGIDDSQKGLDSFESDDE